MVLAADRMLTADYGVVFDAMVAASQTSAAPRWLLERLLMGDGRGMEIAPLGLRRVEAALRQAGFGADEVAVAGERGLDAVIGPATRVVGISVGEPLGLGMNSTTMSEVAGGTIYPQLYFQDLLRRVRRLMRERAPKARLLAGGPGVWQLAMHPDRMSEMGIDHVVGGYVEGNIAGMVRSLMDGKEMPGVMDGQGVEARLIPRLRGASAFGSVEISRGCGWGCRFCVMARTPMGHLPEENILADVETNLSSGMRDTAVLSEDFFRYGASGAKTAPSKLLELLGRLREMPDLRLIQPDHANLSSVAQWSDDELKEAWRLLVGKTGRKHPWVNTGVETASGALLAANGGRPKMGGVNPEEWGAFCETQIRRLCGAGFMPMASLVLGLPGETEDDVRKTLEWVERLGDVAVMIFPMFYAPLDGAPPVKMKSLRRIHWRLFRACYRLNFKWTPRMYADHQRAAGIGWGKRTLLQTLGRMQTWQWQARFKIQNSRFKI
ncbi:MAG: radical SAM protein [Verrucomicrobiae bacterium]|nr:radical SAM protein [Verrucomicrobiae bacterium]